MKESPKENWHFPLKEIAVLFKKKSTEKIEILTIMEQYINKEIIATEIEGLKRSVFTKFDEGVNATAQVLLDFLNTLKAKEVDLEKEFDNYTKDILGSDVQLLPFTHLYNCAKYFF